MFLYLYAMKESSIKILNSFLRKHQIQLKTTEYLPNLSTKKIYCDLNKNIVEDIIFDAYDGCSPLIKDATSHLFKQFNVHIGRQQKTHLKFFFDYEGKANWNAFYKSISEFSKSESLFSFSSIDLLNFCKKINENKENIQSSLTQDFILNLKAAFKDDDTSRIKDYLNFLYSRLVAMNENKKITLLEQFEFNSKFYEKELTKIQLEKLNQNCLNADKKEDISIVVGKYNKLYLDIILNEEKQKTAVTYFTINQYLFDQFDSSESFYGYLYSELSNLYDKIENHKALVFKISNIIHKKKNLKWELYSKLTIFAETFISYKEDRQFFEPWNICIDYLEYKYKISLTLEEKQVIKSYFKGNLKFAELKISSIKAVSQSEIDSFSYLNTGYQFIDCVLLNSDENYPNSEELPFIKNNSELLMVFFKNEIFEKKIPCPVCASLNISGNSYPEVGIKSWECKNQNCLERSKTNRGKRYSLKSYDMQSSISALIPENNVPKELIKIFRKDIVTGVNQNDVYRMIIKYFSFINDKICIYTSEKEEIKFLEKYSKQEKRLLTIEKHAINKTDFKKYKTVYSNFEKENIFEKYSIYIQKESDINKVQNSKIPNGIIVNQECQNYLETLDESSIHNMVTSPPYYNAREYSSWTNLYNYINCMYNITLQTHRCMVDGGVFFYNIGDTFGNPNIISKSTLGNERIPLGAYTIFWFQRAGFELLDNIIWDKGETQTNRHKNDGNYTPFYQRPANSYEHMFIFKKPGKLHLNNKELSLKSNVLKFSPVIKIDNKGNNRLGHTAPFPEEIPNISIQNFSKPGDKILDPFSGSGTTVIVASKLKRYGIGIEYNNEYYKLSVERVNSVLKNKEEEFVLS